MVDNQENAAKWIAKIRHDLSFKCETPAQQKQRTRARLAAYEKRAQYAQSFLKEKIQ